MGTQPTLPAHATPASLIRLDLARQLAEACPHRLAAGIALTGSSARGLAEPGSDAEINHWVDELPSPSARADWLLDAGVTALEAEPGPRDDGSEWFAGSYGGVALETGWQTFAALEASLTPILRGETTDPRHLRLGELLASAILLRPEPRLIDWQRALIDFPDALRDRLLAEWTALLTDEARWDAATALARRGERLAFQPMLVEACSAAVKLLFVVNRRWMAGDKWLLTLAGRLPVMPPDWRARLDAALAAPDDSAVEMVRRWCDDALSLAR